MTRSSIPVSPAPRRSAAASTWIALAAWVVLAGAVAVTVVAATGWKGVLDREAAMELESSTAEASAIVTSRLTLDANLIAQIRGLFTTYPDTTNAEFAALWQATQMSDQFPGGVGFGYIQRVPAAELAAFAAAREQDPVTGLTATVPFTVFPGTPAPQYCLQSVGVWSVDRIQGFQGPPGLDYCAASLVGEAPSPLPVLLAAATDTGVASVITPDQLIPGVFASLLPVYRGGVTPPTVTERRAASIGWIAASFQSSALTDGAVPAGSGLGVTVRHADPSGGDPVIASVSEDPDRAEGDVVRSTAVDSGWTIIVQGSPRSGRFSAQAQAIAILASGLAMGVLAFLFIRLLDSSRERALDLVEERTGELAFLALHDSLTGLPSRALLLDRADAMLARSARDGEPVAAMFIDLDDFKDINDTLGHAAGDELLQAVADRFTSTLRASDTVGRLGGDEFVILVAGPSLVAGVDAVAERILDVLREPVTIAGVSRQVSASIGVASGARPTADEWLRDADIALYEAKAAGKHRYAVFEAHPHPHDDSRPQDDSRLPDESRLPDDSRPPDHPAAPENPRSRPVARATGWAPR